MKDPFERFVEAVSKARQAVISAGGRPDLLRVSKQSIEKNKLFGMNIEVVDESVLPENVAFIVTDEDTVFKNKPFFEQKAEIDEILKDINEPVLSSDGEDALRALHIHGNKRLNDMIEWIALDTFRMRKSETTPDGLVITVKEFQIKEVE